MRHLALRSALLLMSAATLTAQSVAFDWTILGGPAAPLGSGVVDERTGRLVLFGEDGSVFEVADGRYYHRPHVGPAPVGRTGAALVYDRARQRIVMFGGRSGATDLDDTWFWDGIRWTEDTSPQRPQGRSDSALAYDAARDRVVLAGGLARGTIIQSTWEHDGTQWIQRQPATTPGPNSPRMTYDSGRQVCVLITHPGIFAQPVSTWEWDGNDWTLRSSVGPITGSQEGFAYDPVRQRCVLIGGHPDPTQIWEWDGASWTNAGTTAAGARARPIAFYQPRAGRVEMFGGNDLFQFSVGNPGFGSDRSDLWAWNGQALARVHDDLRPPSRLSPNWAHQWATNTAVMFGGQVGFNARNDTWTWDGHKWTERSPATSPPGRTTAGFAYQITNGNVFMFGGFQTGQYLGDLWRWDGNAWTFLGNGGPSGRMGAGLAHELGRDRMILFGGSTGPIFQQQNISNETWEWDGASWTQRQPTNRPRTRFEPAMSTDLLTGTVFLFGGRIGATAADYLNDFWEWDGNNWNRLNTATQPPPLANAAMTFDPFANRNVLTGYNLNGAPAGGSGQFEVWVFDNPDWRLVDSDPSPRLTGFSITHGETRRVTTYDGQLIAERSDLRAEVEELATNCTGIDPHFQLRTRPRLGENGFALEVEASPGRLVAFAWSDTVTSIPQPGNCDRIVGGTLSVDLMAADTFGLAVRPLPIPADRNLLGFDFYVQAAVLDRTAQPRYRLTRGYRVRVGD